MSLGADERDRAAVPVAAQSFRGPQSARSAADDDDPSSVHSCFRSP
jgi:hypothetical protein